MKHLRFERFQQCRIYQAVCTDVQEIKDSLCFNRLDWQSRTITFNLKIKNRKIEDISFIYISKESISFPTNDSRNVFFF